jgi:hypothetical protein
MFKLNFDHREYMSARHVSPGLDLICMVYWLFSQVFLNMTVSPLPYNTLIMVGTCQPVLCSLNLTSLSYFNHYKSNSYFSKSEFWSILPCISFQTSDNSMDEAYHNDYIWIWKSLISIKTLQSSVQIRKRGHFKVVKIACLNAT